MENALMPRNHVPIRKVVLHLEFNVVMVGVYLISLNVRSLTVRRLYRLFVQMVNVWSISNFAIRKMAVHMIVPTNVKMDHVENPLISVLLLQIAQMALLFVQMALVNPHINVLCRILAL